MEESTVDHSEDTADAVEAECVTEIEDVEEAEGATKDTEAGASETADADTDTDEAIVEAVLFASDTPLPPAKIAAATELPPRRIKKAVEQLNKRYAKGGHAFRIEDIAGGYQIMTLPEYHDILRRLLNVKKESRLSQAAMETLAIVAYRQPILRADIEAIRGVASGEVLRGLLERQLVKIVGRAEVIGRPMLYGTSKRFLEVFGLASLDDLPRVEELRSGADKSTSPPSSEEAITPKDEQGSSESCIEANPMSTKTPDDDFLPEADEMEEEGDELIEETDFDDEEFDEEDFDDDEFDDDDDDEDFDDDDEDEDEEDDEE